MTTEQTHDVKTKHVRIGSRLKPEEHFALGEMAYAIRYSQAALISRMVRLCLKLHATQDHQFGNRFCRLERELKDQPLTP